MSMMMISFARNWNLEMCFMLEVLHCVASLSDVTLNCCAVCNRSQCFYKHFVVGRPLPRSNRRLFILAFTCFKYLSNQLDVLFLHVCFVHEFWHYDPFYLAKPPTFFIIKLQVEMCLAQGGIESFLLNICGDEGDTGKATTMTVQTQDLCSISFIIL